MYGLVFSKAQTGIIVAHGLAW